MLAPAVSQLMSEVVRACFAGLRAHAAAKRREALGAEARGARADAEIAVFMAEAETRGRHERLKARVLRGLAADEELLLRTAFRAFGVHREGARADAQRARAARARVARDPTRNIHSAASKASLEEFRRRSCANARFFRPR